jgi:predicted  nucleic acid-binding Zn-ribbon protein
VDSCRETCEHRLSRPEDDAMSNETSDVQTQVSALQSQVSALEQKVSAIEERLAKLSGDDDGDVSFPVSGPGP